MKLHKGDPCEYCGLPHDDVPIGDCKGTDAPDFDPLQLPFLVEFKDLYLGWNEFPPRLIVGVERRAMT